MTLQGPQVLEREGCRLHYWTTGPASGPTVVFTHGVLMDHHIFSAQLPVLARDYRVVVWDVRGHGRSRPLGHDFSLQVATADLTAILDALAVERAVLVGHSMGGYISQELAFRSPHRVAALVMVSSSNLTDRQPLYMTLGAPLSTLGFRLCPTPLLRQLVVFGSGSSPVVKRYGKVVAGNFTRRDFDRIWPALIRGFHHEGDYRPDCPLLLVHGDGDHRVAFGAMKLLTRRWSRSEPTARMEVIPGAGHNLTQENPVRFNRVLVEFLQSPAVLRSQGLRQT